MYDEPSRSVRNFYHVDILLRLSDHLAKPLDFFGLDYAIDSCIIVGFFAKHKESYIKNPQTSRFVLRRHIWVITEMARVRPLRCSATLTYAMTTTIRQEASRKTTRRRVLSFLLLRTISGLLLGWNVAFELSKNSSMFASSQRAADMAALQTKALLPPPIPRAARSLVGASTLKRLCLLTLDAGRCDCCRGSQENSSRPAVGVAFMNY